MLKLPTGGLTFILIERCYHNLNDDNRMTLNASKTESMVFAHPNARFKILQKVCINGVMIEPKNSIKYIGYHLDRGLNHNLHINNLLTRGNIAIKKLYPSLCRNSKITKSNKILIIKQVVRATVTYGSQVFCSASRKHFNRLQVIQKTGASDWLLEVSIIHVSLIYIMKVKFP